MNEGEREAIILLIGIVVGAALVIIPFYLARG